MTELATPLEAPAAFVPLCKETARLFRPIDFQKHEQLCVILEQERGRWAFICSWSHLRHDEERYTHTAATVEWKKRVIECETVRGHINRLRLPCTDINALFLSLWPEDQLSFDAASLEVYTHLRTRWLSESLYAKAMARFRDDRTQPEWSYQDSRDLPLTPHQQITLYGAMNNEGFALFQEAGVGKTPPVICRFNNEAKRLRKRRMYRTIIVVPANVRVNWLEEIMRFSTVRGKAVVLRGTKLKRIKLLTEAFTPTDSAKWVAVILSYETLVNMWPTLKMIDWDLGVLDESHMVKNTGTARTKIVLGRWDRKGQYHEGLRDRCRQRMVLTGTPYTNTHADLWPQLEFLYEGGSGFQDVKAFTRYYGEFVSVNGQSKMVALRHMPLLHERLTRLAAVVTKAEALPDLPEKTRDIHEVEMGEMQKDIYRKLATELAAWSEQHLNSQAAPRSILVTNILTKMLRLSQITSGFVAWDAEVDGATGDILVPSQVEFFETNPKLDAIVAEIKEMPANEKAIVWACWIPALTQTLERLKAEGIEAVGFYGSISEKKREIARKRINEDPSCKVFVGNPEAGGFGLNLHGFSDAATQDTNVTRTFYLARNWKPTPAWQSEDRCHRLGTRVPQRYTDVCVPGTIDTEIRRTLRKKREAAWQVQDVREIMARILEF